MFVDIELMKVVLDTDGFGSLHFFPYVRERTDVIAYVDDGEFGWL